MSALKKKAQEQFALFREPDQYHDTDAADGTAYFALLWRTPDAKFKKQHCYPVGSMPLVLENLDPSCDTWISQAEFFASTRRLVHFKRVGLVWADLDTYKLPALRGKTPEQLLRKLLLTCPKVGLPEPSIVVFSGRGLQAKWLFDAPLPRPALPRWNLVQAELVTRLEEFGADPKSRDGSRVLRLVNTTNSASGEMVRVIHAPLHTYSFDSLADSVLPFTRKQLQEMREERRNAAIAKQQLLLIEGDAAPASRPRKASTARLTPTEASKAGLRAFIPSELNWHRLDDLRTLAKLRNYCHGAPDTMRDAFVFLGSTFLAQSLIVIPQFQAEVRALAKEFAPGWSAERVRQATSGTLERLKQAQAGVKVEYDGRVYDPRYTYANATLLDWLEITPDEERELRTIIGPDEVRRRGAERQAQRRREAGAMTREDWLESHEQRRASARLLRAQGLAWAEVAAQAGYPSAAAARMACK